jgi:antitoxin (DNA-binding transcriptional repressor) of toxin-antitoxin stability system
MQTVTIRELRQNWPAIERRLRATREALLVTRDSEPVAQVSLPPGAAEAAGARPAFSGEAHRQWRGKIWGGKPPRAQSGRWLALERGERSDPA